jgi:hypothetical protein
VQDYQRAMLFQMIALSSKCVSTHRRLDAEISDRALDLGVAEQELHRSQVTWWWMKM